MSAPYFSITGAMRSSRCGPSSPASLPEPLDPGDIEQRRTTPDDCRNRRNPGSGKVPNMEIRKSAHSGGICCRVQAGGL